MHVKPVHCMRLDADLNQIGVRYVDIRAQNAADTATGADGDRIPTGTGEKTKEEAEGSL